MLEHKVYDGRRVLKAVRVVADPGFTDKSHAATEFFVTFLKEKRVFRHGYDFIGVAANVE